MALQLLSWFKGCLGRTWTAGCSQVYLGQLALNLLWFVIFFDAKKPRTAQLENAGWWAESASLAAEMRTGHSVSPACKCRIFQHMYTAAVCLAMAEQVVHGSAFSCSALACRHVPQLLLNPWFSSATS